MSDKKQNDHPENSETALLDISGILEKYGAHFYTHNDEIESSEILETNFRAPSEMTPMLKILTRCGPTLRWLDSSGPVQALPEQHIESAKLLESLGFVFRRNNRTFELRRQRLKKVLQCESNQTSRPCLLEDILSDGCDLA